MLIAQGSTATISFLMADAASPQGVAGIGTIDLILTLNGTLLLNASSTLPNIIGGWYSFTVGPPQTNTLGQLTFEAVGLDPATSQTVVASGIDFQIVPAAVLNPTPTGGPIAIQRNVAIAAFPFPMYTPFPNATLAPGLPVSGQRSLDGGAFVTLAGPVAEMGAGWYSTPLTAAETNGAVIALRFSAPGAQDTLVTIATQVL